MTESEPSILLVAGRFAVRGTCGYTLRLAEHVPDYGYRVQVLCPDAHMVPRELRDALAIQEETQLQIPVWRRLVLPLVARQWANDPPDLIHIQSRSAARLGVALAQELHCPYVQTVHDYQPGNQPLVVDRRLCRGVVAVSEPVRSELIAKNHLPESLVSVIHSGVDVAPAESIPLVLPEDRVPVIGTAGPLEAVKGFPFFLAAAARVLATGRDVEFVIAGAGPEEQSLRRLARELAVDQHVTFVPNVSNFSEALAAMDVFCLPSLQQGLGTIMLEAMALARPVIATRVGGVYRIVRDGETGLLVPPSNSDQLSQRMLELLDHPLKARAIGQAARDEVASGFNTSRMVEQTVALYRSVVGNDQVDSSLSRLEAVATLAAV